MLWGPILVVSFPSSSCATDSYHPTIPTTEALPAGLPHGLFFLSRFVRNVLFPPPVWPKNLYFGGSFDYPEAPLQVQQPKKLQGHHAKAALSYGSCISPQRCVGCIIGFSCLAGPPIRPPETVASGSSDLLGGTHLGLPTCFHCSSLSFLD